MAQVSSELVTPDIRRVGERLACLCKSCKNSVGDCAMLGCHYSKPAREKIRDMQAAGSTDDAIVDSFVKEMGRQALVVPPNDGFLSLAWWMPPVMIGLGLALIYWFIRRMRRPGAATPLPQVDAATLERYKATIDKDLAKLD
jgi:cytochrome c-type biogenesis protein CcmH